MSAESGHDTQSQKTHTPHGACRRRLRRMDMQVVPDGLSLAIAKQIVEQHARHGHDMLDLAPNCVLSW